MYTLRKFIPAKEKTNFNTFQIMSPYCFCICSTTVWENHAILMFSKSCRAKDNIQLHMQTSRTYAMCFGEALNHFNNDGYIQNIAPAENANLYNSTEIDSKFWNLWKEVQLKTCASELLRNKLPYRLEKFVLHYK